MKDLDMLIKELNDENVPELLKYIEQIKETKNKDDIKKLLDFIKHRDFPPDYKPEIINKIKIASIKVLGDLKEGDAVTLLIETLKSKNTRIKNATSRALGQIGDEKAIEALGETLKDEVAKVSAAKALGEIGSEKSLEPLLNMLKDRDVEARGAAAVSLGQIKNKKAVEELTKILEQDEEVNVRRLAAIAIGEIGDEGPVPVLIKKLDDQFMNVSTSAADALIKIGTPAIKPLAEVIENKLAADALIKIGEPSVEELIKLLGKEKTEIREIAAKCLGKIGSARAVPSLVNQLKNNSGRCLKTMRDAIFFICRTSLDPLEEALRDNEEDAHEAIRDIFFDIGKLTDKGLERLEKELEKENPVYRKLIIKAMGKLEDMKAFPCLKEIFLSTDNKEVKKEILKAIINIGPGEDLLDFLNKAFEEKDPEIKGLAAEAIISTGDPSAIKIITELFKTDDKKLKETALKGLGLINHPDTLSPLLDALRKEEKNLKLIAIESSIKKKEDVINSALADLLKDPDPDIQVAVIKAIRKQGNKGLVKEVKGLRKNAHSKVREEAGKTLKHLGVENQSLWSRLFGKK